MTEEHQNVDKHNVTVMSTENRVSGNHLSDAQPEEGIFAMANGHCLPSPRDNAEQRHNYIVLVERVIAQNIPCLQFLSETVTAHIPHLYRDEVKAKTDTVRILYLLVHSLPYFIHLILL